MRKQLFILGILSLAAAASCSKNAEAEYFAKAKTVTESEIAANLSAEGITPGSNRIVLKNNNKGISGMWDYNVGTTTLSEATVDVPFLGEQTFKFYANTDKGTVIVEKKVNVENIDYPSDPLWTRLAGEEASGRKWKWNTTMGGQGCYGAGGYGWSPLYPDWNSISDGKAEYNDYVVYPDEYIVLDLNGAANVTYHKHDGSVVKGTFSCNSSVSPEKAEVGWQGTLTLKGAGAEFPLPCPGTYYSGLGVGSNFDIAKLTDTELVLIQVDSDQGGIFKDPAWASASTHWCFIAE